MPFAEGANGDFYFFKLSSINIRIPAPSSSASTYMQPAIHIKYYLLPPPHPTPPPNGFHITSACVAISKQMGPLHPVISMNLLPRDMQLY